MTGREIHSAYGDVAPSVVIEDEAHDVAVEEAGGDW